MAGAFSSIVQSSRAPFKVRSFRYQWTADLATSWAFEMEILVLGWYVLVESGSVLLLVVYGALQYTGALISPFLGIAGDRVGYRILFMLTRGLYAIAALTIALLAYFDLLTPLTVIAIATVVGVIRPSDLMMRYALIGQTQPTDQLTSALGISRMTSDSARIAGALAGAGIFAQFGMVPVYISITLLYVTSFYFSMGVAGKPATEVIHTARPSPFTDLQHAFSYVWSRPVLLGTMSIAFLVNFLAFPFSLGLLPYIARTIYEVGQTGLGVLSASFAFGALIGSVVLGTNRFSLGTGRAFLIATGIWFGLLFFFGFTTHFMLGVTVLVCAGFVQSICMIPLAAVMLRATEPQYRGRIMGMRILAIWGLPVGLLIAGPMIDAIGFVATTMLYSALGVAATLAIALKWRSALWDKSAPANQHG
jgi:predicted MFS family arabinose efflux permease